MKINIDYNVMVSLISGSLCVRLLSHDLEADVQHGEHTSLMKFQRFSGRDFEMQFACKFKVTFRFKNHFKLMNSGFKSNRFDLIEFVQSSITQSI